MSSRWTVLGLVVALLAMVTWQPIERRARAARMLLEMSGGKTPDDSGIVIRDLTIPMEGASPIAARVYFERGQGRGQGIVLAHGVHRDGIHEKRLVALATRLARAGMVVMTPELTDIADYRITERGIAEIRAAVSLLSSRSDLVDDPKVGLIGISFAGGLGLVAATDPGLQSKLRYVASIGGHHRLDRVLRFFVTDTVDAPGGPTRMRAHDYGLVVLVYGHIEHFVPLEDRDTMRMALRAWLEEDRDAARIHAKRCRTDACTRLFEHVANDTLEAVGPEVLAMINRSGDRLSALSPAGRLDRITVPVFVLHGSADSVIPPAEAAWAREELRGQPHRVLVTPLLDHVEVSKEASRWDELELVELMARLL